MLPAQWNCVYRAFVIPDLSLIPKVTDPFQTRLLSKTCIQMPVTESHVHIYPLIRKTNFIPPDYKDSFCGHFPRIDGFGLQTFLLDFEN